MGRKRKAKRVIGIVLLIVLLVPVIVLSIPQTYTQLVLHEVPMGPGLGSMIETEYVEVTYIPLINVFQNSQFGPIDIAIMVGYVALFGLGIWLVVRSSKQSLAVSDYDKAIELNPSNADAYCDRGDAYDEMGEYSRVIADYSKAIKLDPNHASAYFGRGRAYGEIGEYDKAILDFNKVTELNPRDVLTYYNRGLAYSEKGNVSEAVSDLEKCITLSTDPELIKDAQQALSEIKNTQ